MEEDAKITEDEDDQSVDRVKMRQIINDWRDERGQRKNVHDKTST